jgi:hypothetical protein
MKIGRFTSSTAVALVLLWVSSASATPCSTLVTTSTCTVGSVTYNPDPGDALKGLVEIDDSALTFLADFSPANQSNSTIASAVEDFLAAAGVSGVNYLGRQDGTGTLAGTGGVTISSLDGGMSGTWTFDPLASGLVAGYLVIHAGGGLNDILYEINTPGVTGVWDTSENFTGKPRNQAAISTLDLFSGNGTLPVPEPLTLALFGAGLAGVAAMRRRKKAVRAARGAH